MHIKKRRLFNLCVLDTLLKTNAYSRNLCSFIVDCYYLDFYNVTLTRDYIMKS